MSAEDFCPDCGRYTINCDCHQFDAIDADGNAFDARDLPDENPNPKPDDDVPHRVTASMQFIENLAPDSAEDAIRFYEKLIERIGWNLRGSEIAREHE